MQLLNGGVFLFLSVKVDCVTVENNFYLFRDEDTSFLSGKFISIMMRCGDTEISEVLYRSDVVFNLWV